MKTKTKLSLIMLIALLFISLGCGEEKIPRLNEIIGHKSIYYDYSLDYNVKYKIVNDTLFVEIALINISFEPVFVPLNNWWIKGRWPMVMRSFTNIIGKPFPDFNKTYSCNIFLYCNNNEWEEPHEELLLPMFQSYPLVNKIEPKDTFFLRLKIVDRSIKKSKLDELKIRGNILFAPLKNHLKLVKLFKLDETQIFRNYKVIEYSYNMNPVYPDNEIIDGSQKPYYQFSDSTSINIFSVYPRIKKNSIKENLKYFRELYLFYRDNNYNLGYELPDLFNSRVSEYYSDSLNISHSRNDLDCFRELFHALLSETYCYSVKFKNY